MTDDLRLMTYDLRLNRHISVKGLQPHQPDGIINYLAALKDIIMRTTKQTLKWFCDIALIEGISMVVLITFSVLKRTTDYEWALLGVKYVGWAHGVLFIAYVYLLWMCTDRYKWRMGRVLTFFVASLIPFAPFFVERKLRREG